MALRSNVDELPEIARFCRERTRDYFRFDAMLHLRYDRDETRNAMIREERLSPARIAELDREDEERWASLEKSRDTIVVEAEQSAADHLFRCGVRSGEFAVSYDGVYRPCASLWHPAYTSDLRETSVADAWRKGVELIDAARTDDAGFRAACGSCRSGTCASGARPIWTSRPSASMARGAILLRGGVCARSAARRRLPAARADGDLPRDMCCQLRRPLRKPFLAR